MQVVRPGDLGDSELATWRAYQRDDAALTNPFLAPEFAMSVDAARDDARVGIIDDAGTPAAFFAFSRGDDGDGRPIGQTICDAQALVAHPEFVCDPRALVRAAGLSAWHFDHLITTQEAFAPFHRALHRSPVIDVSRGVAAYRQQVRATSKDVLAQCARRQRKLQRDVGDVTFEWHTADPSVLDTLLGWKSAQYRQTGVWDRFAQPWIVAVVRRLAATATEGLTGVVAALRADGELVAAHFGLAGTDQLCWWFPAYDPRFSPYSPGLLLLLALVDEAPNHSVTVVDLGRGEHHYKLRVANGTYPIAEGVVPAAGSTSPSSS